MTILRATLMAAALLFPAGPAAAAGTAAANEDGDLDLIPQAVREAPPAPMHAGTPAVAGPNRVRFTLDNAVQFHAYRDPPVPSPAAQPGWSNLLRLGARGDAALAAGADLRFDTVAAVTTQREPAFRWRRDLRFDVKELYVAHAASPTLFAEAGRINTRNGVALGFNPTDVFKVNAIINRTTEDPSQLRDSRLGTLSARLLQLWDGGAVTLVAAPRVDGTAGRWWTDGEVAGLRLDRTNDRNRVLLKLSHELAPGFSPELLGYLEGGRPFAGANASYAVDDALLVYGEWLGGRRRPLAEEALAPFRDAGTLHPAVAAAFPAEGTRFLHQAAAGASYTTAGNLTLALEYHFNGAGLDRDDWRRWFDAGLSRSRLSGGGLSPRASSQLWAIRGLARDRQEPLSRHTAFLRVQQPDLLIPDLTLTGLAQIDLAQIDLGNGSRMVQAELGYALGPASTMAVRIGHMSGPERSQYGSAARATSATVQAAFHF